VGGGLPTYVLRAGQSSVTQTITLANAAGQRADLGHGIYALPYANTPPQFVSAPPTAASAGQPYRYEALALDPDGSTLAYLLLEAPEGMALDGATGVLTWTPGVDSPEQASVVLRAYDTRGGRATQAFAIDVAGVNRAPAVAALPASLRLREGRAFELGLDASDADGDLLVFSADRLPPGARFDFERNVLAWSPGYDAAGVYRDVQLLVSDGLHTVTRSFDLVVDPANAPPQMSGVPDRAVREGDPIRIAFLASDLDADPLTWSSALLPPGAFLDPSLGVFEWTPSFTQAGTYAVPFRVSDGKDFSERTITLTVTNVNAAPQFDSFAGMALLEGQALSLRAFAFDPDNPLFVPPERKADGTLVVDEDSPAASVTYTAEGLPPGATFDAGTAMLTWTPGFDQAGEYLVRVTATDDGDGTGQPLASSAEALIVVRNANRAPVLPELNNVSVTKGEALELQIDAADPDGNPLTLSFSGLPRFATFTQTGDASGTLRLAPGERDRGDYVVTLTAGDDGDGGGAKQALSASRTFVISSESPSEPPLLAPVGHKVAVVGQTLRFTLRAADLDQDALAFAADALPPGATLTPGPGYGTAVFEWTPGPADRGTHALRLTVSDDGNGGLGPVGSDEETISIVVRDANAAPVLLPVGPQAAQEGEPFTLTLSALDADGDALLYSATGLPPGASFDARAGVLTWTPNLFQAGQYGGITVSVSDGAASSSETFAITVAPTNQAPLLAGIPPLGGQEQRLLQFTLPGTDPDGDALVYEARSALPAGAFFDPSTGLFEWTPTYDQAGGYTLSFAALDPSGAEDTLSVSLAIADVNRLPVLSFTNHRTLLGRELAFTLGGADADSNETLSFSAEGLPEGATLDPVSGAFRWIPGPGQAGDYLVLVQLTDGKGSVTRPLVLRATTMEELPDAAIELTPGFPVVPGQAVVATVLADSFSAIAAKSLTIDGQAVALDERGRATWTPGAAGLVRLVATATDVDGFTRQVERILKVRDPADTAAPAVSLDSGLEGMAVTGLTALSGAVVDGNLESWKLELALAGSEQFFAIAQGTQAFDAW
jgi:hypothetical protein